MTPPDDDPRPYRVYGGSGTRERPRDPAPDGADRPDYRVYRSRPRSLLARLRGGDESLGGLREPRRPRGAGGRRPITVGRVVKWVALAIVGWLLLSLVLFLVSAQLERGKVSSAARAALAGGFPLTSRQTVLVLGSDQRPKNSKEPGAHSGPSRSDTIMLMRVGAGASARLSIPRDTVVDIPGHGRQKINAAYAFGGTALAIKTVEAFTGVRVNHVVEVDLTNFPKFIDALGGIDLKTSCIIGDINGGTRNGGISVDLKPGTHHLNGKMALALSRLRHNRCNPAESDLTRVRRQQQILSAIRSKMTSLGTFFRLPWVSWRAPQAVKTDMGGFSLIGLAGALAIGGSPPVRVLKPSAFVTLPDGESALEVSPSEVHREMARFLKG